MARVPIANPNVDRTSSTNYPGAQPGSHYSHQSTHDRNELNNNSIAEQVMNSPAYKSAYNILSQESDKSWLQRLEMIPYSVSDASKTFLDNWGLTSNFNDKQDANYQYCIEQISALMAEYQSWKNSLPTTQVQQLSDAGINSAITGQGIDGSSIPNVGVNSNPSSVQSAQPIEIIMDAASFILDSTTGLANLALQYKNLGLSQRIQEFNEDSALLDFKKYASEHGIYIRPNSSWKELIEQYGYTTNDPAGESRYSDNILMKYLTHHTNSSIIGGLASIYPELQGIVHVGDKNVPHVFTGIGNTPIYLDATNKAMIDLLSAQRIYDAKIKKFTAEFSEYNADKAFEEKTTFHYNKIVSEFESTRAEIATELIQKLHNSKDPADQLLLSRILWNATRNTVELERKENEWFNANKAAGFVDTLF